MEARDFSRVRLHEVKITIYKEFKRKQEENNFLPPWDGTILLLYYRKGKSSSSNTIIYRKMLLPVVSNSLFAHAVFWGLCFFFMICGTKNTNLQPWVNYSKRTESIGASARQNTPRWAVTHPLSPVMGITYAAVFTGVHTFLVPPNAFISSALRSDRLPCLTLDILLQVCFLKFLRSLYGEYQS